MSKAIAFLHLTALAAVAFVLVVAAPNDEPSTSSVEQPAISDMAGELMSASLDNLKQTQVRLVKDFKSVNHCYHSPIVIGSGGSGTVRIARPCTTDDMTVAMKSCLNRVWERRELLALEALGASDDYVGVPRLFETLLDTKRGALTMVMQYFDGATLREHVLDYDSLNGALVRKLKEKDLNKYRQANSVLWKVLNQAELQEERRAGAPVPDLVFDADTVALMRDGLREMEDHLLFIMMKVTAIIERIHNMGLVHLDLKPLNVLVGRGYDVMVIDFGGVLPMSSRDRKAMQSSPKCDVYSPYWRAPEMPDMYGYASDVYMLGRIAESLVPSGGLIQFLPRLKLFIDLATNSDPAERPSTQALLIDRAIFGEQRAMFRRYYGVPEDQEDDGVLPVPLTDLLMLSTRNQCRFQRYPLPNKNCSMMVHLQKFFNGCMRQSSSD